MAEFTPGEIAIYQPEGKWEGKCGPGSECEIVRRGEPSHGRPTWLCRFPGDPGPREDGLWLVLESSLRKRPPPEQPADEDFQRDLDKWLKRDRTATA